MSTDDRTPAGGEVSGRDPSLPIPEDFHCDYAPRGQRACDAAICDCFVGVYNDDPFGIHPEAFIVNWHNPLAVFTADGMLFVKCSCDPHGIRPQSAVWLREHWAGTADSGIAALREVIAHQSTPESP